MTDDERHLCDLFAYGLTRIHVENEALTPDNDLADLNTVAMLCLGVKVATAAADTIEDMLLCPFFDCADDCEDQPLVGGRLIEFHSVPLGHGVGDAVLVRRAAQERAHAVQQARIGTRRQEPAAVLGRVKIEAHRVADEIWHLIGVAVDRGPPAAAPRGPMLLSMYEAGSLKLDELITHRYRLDEINDAIKHLREGSNIRGVIDFTLGSQK
jgi:hypothetical protein